MMLLEQEANLMFRIKESHPVSGLHWSGKHGIAAWCQKSKVNSSVSTSMILQDSLFCCAGNLAAKVAVFTFAFPSC